MVRTCELTDQGLLRVVVRALVTMLSSCAVSWCALSRFESLLSALQHVSKAVKHEQCPEQLLVELTSLYHTCIIAVHCSQ